MKNNKKFFGRKFLNSATAAVVIIAGLGFGNTATSGSFIRQSNTGLARPLNATSIAKQTQVNPTSTRSTWRGATFAEWTQRWWRWWMSIPLGVGPTNDKTGAQCGINQSGLVWFIGGPLGNTFERSCNIPKGKAILSPITDFINDYPCPAPPVFEPAAGQTLEDFLISGVVPIIDGVTVHTAELDGKPLHEHRITTGLFSFTGASDLVALDPCVTGSPQLGVSDGYFIFINPLPVGQHILHIHSELPAFGFSSDGTYHLNIIE